MLQEDESREQFEEKVIDLVEIGVPNLLGRFNDGVLRPCVVSRVEEAMQIHGGEIKRGRRQYEERQMDTR